MEKLKKKPNDGLTAIFPLEYLLDDSSDRAEVVATIGRKSQREARLETCSQARQVDPARGP